MKYFFRFFFFFQNLEKENIYFEKTYLFEIFHFFLEFERNYLSNLRWKRIFKLKEIDLFQLECVVDDIFQI